jgi:hypothetical protein
MEELNRRVGRLRDKACCAAGEGTGAGKLRSLSGDGWEEAFMEIKEPRDVQLKTVSFTSAMEKSALLSKREGAGGERLRERSAPPPLLTPEQQCTATGTSTVLD